MKYSDKYYKELEKLSYYVTDSIKFEKPNGWKSIKKYENNKNGFKAEVFENKEGKKFLIYAGTNPLTWNDDSNDIQL